MHTHWRHPISTSTLTDRRQDGHAGTRAARRWVVASWKGGTGKSSSAIGLGYALAEQGRRVLLVDLDPQANLTDQMAVNAAPPTIADLLLAGLYGYPDPAPSSETVRPSAYPGLDVLPAPVVDDPTHAELPSAEVLIAGRDPISGQRRLARGLEPLRDTYDHIIIDAPPQVGMLVVNALCAVDGVIISLRAERHAIKGFASLSHLIEGVRTNYNPQLRLAGAIVIADRRHIETRASLRQLEQAHIPLLGPPVPLASAAPAKAQRARAPLAALFPDHPIARAYRAAAAQLEEGA